jgi:hypothetical protein
MRSGSHGGDGLPALARGAPVPKSLRQAITLATQFSTKSQSLEVQRRAPVIVGIQMLNTAESLNTAFFLRAHRSGQNTRGCSIRSRGQLSLLPECGHAAVSVQYCRTESKV